MNFNPNELFFKIAKIYSDKFNGKETITICNEGGTRSSKTWDIFHFIIAYCLANTGNDIYILRDTLINCRDFTLKEFISVMKMCGIWDENNFLKSPKPYYNLNGNNIFFRGQDDESNTEGYPSDIIFFNEALESSKSKYDGLAMRCRKLILMDWNPKYLKHWCFDLEGQPNTYFIHSTYLNNKFLQQSIIKKIQSYEPIKENIDNGTADEFRWKVYGLGLRATSEQIIFKHYQLFDELPKEHDYKFYGLDFGFTNDPSALVEVIIDGKNLYITELLYQTNLTNDELADIIKTKCEKDIYIIADSAEPKSITELRLLNIPVIPAQKGPDSVKHGINKILEYNLFINKNSLNLINEIIQYQWKKEKDGNVLNIPLDSANHLIDAFRYALTKFFK